MTAEALLAVASRHFDEHEWFTARQLYNKAGGGKYSSALATLVVRDRLHRRAIQPDDPRWTTSNRWEYRLG